MSVMFATVKLRGSAYDITIYDQLGVYGSTTVFDTKEEELISVFMLKGYVPNQFSIQVITFTKQCANHVGAEEAIKAIKKNLVN